MRTLVLLTLFFVGSISLAETVPATVNVEGKCSLKDSSDEFSINLSVVKEGKTSTEAMESAKKSYNELLKKVKSLDLASSDLTTSQYNVYKSEQRDRDGKVVETTYRANISLEIKAEDIPKLSKVLSTVEDVGLENVHGLIFSLSEGKKEVLRNKCYEIAVKQARSKAEKLASGLGLKIKSVASISESGVSAPVYPRVMTMKMASSSEGLSTEAGNQTVEVRVQVSFLLADQ